VGFLALSSKIYFPKNLPAHVIDKFNRADVFYDGCKLCPIGEAEAFLSRVEPLQGGLEA
jgi:hypothetical protein